VRVRVKIICYTNKVSLSGRNVERCSFANPDEVWELISSYVSCLVVEEKEDESESS
jgi:hypothetical protein